MAVTTFGIVAENGPDSERRAPWDAHEIGAKAASLCRMASLGLPVPAGFVLPIALGRELALPDPSPEALAGLEASIASGIAALESATGRRLGDPARPLLVSIRSGGAQSQPGMLSTVLNVGMTAEIEQGLRSEVSDAPDFVADVQRRFSESWEASVGGVPPKKAAAQLRLAIQAVARSWNSERARAYREQQGISHDGGTSITVQVMVFGNRNDRSASGVVFSRHPVTGEPCLAGDVLFVAQGPDVVDGTHNPQPLSILSERHPEVWDDLNHMVQQLEQEWGTTVDVEFTIDDGELWLLQCRPARPAEVDTSEDLASADQLQLLGSGTAASGGTATGYLEVSIAEAQQRHAAGEPVVLCRPETSPADVPGMQAAVALVTASGGMASHAAIIAREWGLPAAVGVEALEITDDGITIGGRHVQRGTVVTVDGNTGQVLLGGTALAVAASTPTPVATLPVAQDELVFSDDDLLHLVMLKGATTPQALSSGLLAPVEQVDAVTSRLLANGMLSRLRSERIVLSPQGRQRVQSVHKSEAVEVRPAMVDVFERFDPLDDRCKQYMADFQRQGRTGPSVGPSPDQVSGLLNQLRTNVHQPVADLLCSMADLWPRANRYERRLSAALAGAEDDFSLIAHPLRDSYHMVWFELHEDLLRLGGRQRT